MENVFARLCRPYKTKNNLYITLPSLALAILLMAGCGGGGGGGSSSGNSQSQSNTPPNAENDSATTDENTSVSVNVTGNDSDDDGVVDADTVTIVDEPTNGSVTNDGNGFVTYTPNDGFGDAVDSFTYTVKDDDGANSNKATVTITVNAVNTPPTARDFCDKTPLNTELMGNLSDLVEDPDSVNLRFSTVIDGQIGSVEIDPVTGMFTYRPNFDERGVDTFIYEVNDQEEGIATGEVTVIIGKTRIMPLGDSITAGVFGINPDGTDILTDGERIGYRKKLYDDLDSSGAFIDFVGSQRRGQAAGIKDPDHEGYPGARDDEFVDGINNPNKPNKSAPDITELLDANPPDIILLHIGSNDVNRRDNAQGGVADTSADDVEQILQAIDDWEVINNNPITVFLALITDRTTQFQANFPNPDVDLFNSNILMLATQRKTDLNDDIVVVDQHNALQYPEDLNPDEIHPNNGGYQKMAETWLESMLNPQNLAPDKLPKCTLSP